MTLKNEDYQERTKRLRFKSITNIRQCPGDIIDKSGEEIKNKGKYFNIIIIIFK